MAIAVFCNELKGKSNHYDHLDLRTPRRVQERLAPRAVTGPRNGRYLSKANMRSTTELDWWETVETDGVRLWGGFIVEAGGAAIYFVGDSGYCPRFAEIGRGFPNLDLALIPIGA
jgi:L-ascorbate metabolism protein UlaG (beta-lactamase superfamily)